MDTLCPLTGPQIKALVLIFCLFVCFGKCSLHWVVKMCIAWDRRDHDLASGLSPPVSLQHQVQGISNPHDLDDLKLMKWGSRHLKS